MRHLASLSLALLAAACQSAAPSQSAWTSETILDLGNTGIWCVKPYQIFRQYAEPELLALDDQGRAHVIVSYGGRWTTYTTGADGSWLGVSTQADIDLRIPGPELYSGAESGRIWQLVAHPQGVIDQRLVAQIDGRAIHSLLSGDFDTKRPGVELLAFTEPAELWLLTPRLDRDGFDTRRLRELSGRIRDAVVLPAEPGQALGPAQALLASRAGELLLMSGMDSLTVLDSAPQGVGRVCLAPHSDRSQGVAYFTREDGSLLRLAWSEGRFGAAQRIYAGAKGPRGIAAGRLDPDPARECVAIYGYSGRVELLRRPLAASGEQAEPEWESETLFVDRDKGHWLSAVELDGRNSTDELVCSGYAARVVLLSRQH
jgi:hypothetical protein